MCCFHELAGFDHIVTDDLVQVLVPWATQLRSMKDPCSQRNSPVEMEILRDEELKVQETGVGQLLCNVLDCDVRLRDYPNRV